MDVRDLLADCDLGDDLLRCAHIAHTETRRQDLGKAAGVDDTVFGVQALDGRNVCAGEPEIAVGVVLQNDEVILARQVVQTLALFQRHHSAGGVLEVGNHIDQLGAFACLDCLFQSG